MHTDTQKRAYIFIGQSGSGKGTQVTLLEQTLQEHRLAATIFHLETGKKFRELIDGNTYTATLTKALMDHGQLPPPFLGVHMWSHTLIDDYNGEEVVFMDGTPRVASEVPLLLSACAFYGWQPHVVYIKVSDAWAREKLLARGRADDEIQEVDGRIRWFHDSVVPAIELLRVDTSVVMHEINGEQPIESVHKEIMNAIEV